MERTELLEYWVIAKVKTNDKPFNDLLFRILQHAEHRIIYSLCVQSVIIYFKYINNTDQQWCGDSKKK